MFLFCLFCFVYIALPLKGEEFGRFFNISKQHYRIWRIIGAELGIDGDLLKTIERDHLNDEDRLHAMIDSASPALTHEMTTKVLQSECVSNAVKGLCNVHNIISVHLFWLILGESKLVLYACNARIFMYLLTIISPYQSNCGSFNYLL